MFNVLILDGKKAELNVGIGRYKCNVGFQRMMLNVYNVEASILAI